MRGHERLWAKVYDGCTQNHAHFFVITTYREWVFGAFSKGQCSDSPTFPVAHNVTRRA